MHERWFDQYEMPVQTDQRVKLTFQLAPMGQATTMQEPAMHMQSVPYTQNEMTIRNRILSCKVHDAFVSKCMKITQPERCTRGDQANLFLKFLWLFF